MRTEIRVPLSLPAFTLLALLVSPPGAFAAGNDDARAVAEAFSRALEAGDATAAQTLLLPDVLIYESGGQESSAAEYSGHHMKGDMAFLAAVKRERISQSSGGRGDSAWVATRSRLSGTYKDKEIDIVSTESLFLTRTEGGWRIAHVHWSSGPYRKPK